MLEAGSDVFPNDPRPVAFLLDHRALDMEIEAVIESAGSGPGVVLRRVGHNRYYAALLDTEAATLRIVARDGDRLDELARTTVTSPQAPLTLTLSALGASPTSLRADLVDAGGVRTEVAGSDSTQALQRPGDPGVLATAQTLFPSESNSLLPALGNVHLLPWSVQEGQAVMQTALGQAVIERIRERSTVRFSEVQVSVARRRRRRATKPAVVAAFTGRPVPGGAELHVASDVPATVAFEISTSPRFRNSRAISAGRTGKFHAAAKKVNGLPAGERIYWRARLARRGRTSTGPVRSFQNGISAKGSLRIAVAACGSQFGPIFDHLAGFDPDVFVWQGDLNYPDTHGPLAQTSSGYAGIWRDFLSNPRLADTLERAAFAPQRDDHDWGTQDANSTTVSAYPWAIGPWEALMNRRTFYRFEAGPAEVWVLDQRRFKSDPAIADGPEKTLIGTRQRKWLLTTLARSRARFKVICSPTTVFMPANARDGNWATGYAVERETLLSHIRDHVHGEAIFLTGDTHLTGVHDSGGNYEVRAAPVGIPKPNDVTLVDPLAAENLRRRDGVAYAADDCHFTALEVRGKGRDAELELSLVREDGQVPYTRRFGPRLLDPE